MTATLQYEIFRPAVMRQGRVLVVDDEISIRMPIRRSLLQAGLEVVEADDGHAAITALRAGDNALMVDAVLCDIRMPKIDGTDLIPYLRVKYPSIPIIVLTGYPDIDLAVRLMKVGVRDYLVKPASKQDLLQALMNAVDHHTIFKNQFVV
ncbi:MAG TPA: response regulator [Nitrospiraceae bacterium]|nr:response regulator [Nitrospiraceae bacterium]